MSDTLLFIPPCCVDKKLPKAIHQATHNALSFYTHGDVPMEKFYRAVSYLVSDPHVFVLSMPNITNFTMAFLAQCFERKWITDLILSTNRDVSPLLEKYLSPFKEHILYTSGNHVTEVSSHIVLYSRNAGLSISGPMFNISSEYHLVAYSMLYHPTFDNVLSLEYSSPLLNILQPDIMYHRKAVRKEGREIKSAALNRFLNSDFPPYEE